MSIIWVCCGILILSSIDSLTYESFVSKDIWSYNESVISSIQGMVCQEDLETFKASRICQGWQACHLRVSSLGA